MSADTIFKRYGSQLSDAAWLNLFKAALSESLLPRNSSGVVTSLAGNIGNSAYQWLKAYIMTGFWSAGDIKMHHSFNSEQGPGHGWMLCDGRVISEAAYNTEHGAGSWATYIGTSPLNGKYLPDFNGMIAIGKDTTTQAGSIAITGVSGIDTTATDHAHQWFKRNSAAVHDQYYNSSGVATDLSNSAYSGQPAESQIFALGQVTASFGELGFDAYVQFLLAGSVGAGGTVNAIETQYYMRII